MPVFNSASVIADQLDALTIQDFSEEWELVIADNGCTDATVAIALAYADRLPLRIIDASARRGDVAARNIAVPETGGSLIVFCDSDDVVGTAWLSRHVRQLATTEVTIGPYDMRVEMSGRDTGMHVDVPMYGTYGYLPYGLSANMGVRREAFDSIGGFNEDYRVGYDVEFCWRAQVSHLSLGAAEGAIVAKRKRGDAAGSWRQHKAFGVADVRLYNDYGAHGMPRALALAFKTYAWLVFHLPDLVDEQRRLRWVGVAAQRVGRIIGSVRTRTVYL
jgi:glycosyltransferase involved in cell wall biosynthesis